MILIGGMDRGIEYHELEEYLHAHPKLTAVFMYATIHGAQPLRLHGNKDLEFTIGGGLARQTQCGTAGYLQPHARNTAVVDLRFLNLIVGIAVNDKVFCFTYSSVEGIFLIRCSDRLNQSCQKYR